MIVNKSWPFQKLKIKFPRCTPQGNVLLMLMLVKCCVVLCCKIQ